MYDSVCCLAQQRRDGQLTCKVVHATVQCYSLSLRAAPNTLLWSALSKQWLKSWSGLQITTAAITTTQDGNVYDVFQVKLDEDHASWTAQDVQCQVHSNLYSSFLSNSGDKRRRIVGV